MLQDIKDEVLAGEPLYVIEGADGTVLQDNVKITRKTPVVEEATELNRATLANLQGDLYTHDRYNKPTVSYDGTNYINNLSLPLTSYEAGKIVNIEGSSYGDITSFKNPYLNINNLGTKLINGTIETGKKYTLIYNGENWDIKPETIFATGAVANAASIKTVELGFEPDLVICYTNNNNLSTVAGTTASTNAQIGYVPRILTKAYLADDGQITSNGFTFKTNANITTRYIAIKF